MLEMIFGAYILFVSALCENAAPELWPMWLALAILGVVCLVVPILWYGK